jgi:5-methylcytosine-specific restriction endonuclease McrA
MSLSRLIVLLVVVLAVALLAGAAARGRRARDPARWFDTSARSAGRALAGGRCEYPARGAPWRRCRHTAVESDHFIPWARGGATSMANLVAACRWHNQDKGARAPSPWLTRTIAHRRRGYFPRGRATRPGQRYRRRR